ncbi:hypothetical protein NVP1081O_128 [Vibrio phage 1.081.O._10N.286.52.C2]|nr:hypothetical protein NVP1081O_128 [Vibrio phage 1.081.O._10N.286.52.C2]
MKFSTYTNETQSLDEAMDRAAHFVWDQSSNRWWLANFRVSGVEYHTVVIRSEYQHASGYQYENAEVSFQVRDATGTWSHKLVKGNSADAMTVLATVLASTFDYIDTNKPERVEYTAYQDADPADAKKRLRLYETMTRRGIKGTDYEYTRNGNKFVVVRKGFAQRVADAVGSSIEPVGMRTTGRSGISINIAQANAAAFATAFDALDSKKSGRLAQGRAAVGAGSYGQLQAELLTPRGERVPMTDEFSWKQVLVHPIWTFDDDTPDTKDPYYMVGEFQGTYVVLDDGLLRVFNDETFFIRYITPGSGAKLRNRNEI